MLCRRMAEQGMPKKNNQRNRAMKRMLFTLCITLYASTVHAQQLEKYTESITNSRIGDFLYKGQTLHLNFLDGSSYEYFGVPKNIYLKFVSSATPDRFARRHIYHSFVYRKVSKAADQN